MHLNYYYEHMSRITFLHTFHSNIHHSFIVSNMNPADFSTRNETNLISVCQKHNTWITAQNVLMILIIMHEAD